MRKIKDIHPTAETAERIYFYHCKKAALWRKLLLFDKIAAKHDMFANFYFSLYIHFKEHS